MKLRLPTICHFIDLPLLALPDHALSSSPSLVLQYKRSFFPAMASYADIAAHNAPPPSQQPVADPNLLEGSYHPGNSGQVTSLPDVDSGKVNIVPSSQDLDNIKTESSERNKDAQAATEREAAHLEKKYKDAERKAKSAAKKGERK